MNAYRKRERMIAMIRNDGNNEAIREKKCAGV